MNITKVLFVNTEMIPFVSETPLAKRFREVPQAIQEAGFEIRTFMPKWGIINERRNQLHEVIRLSGMNLIINDTDHSLLIKVASIQAARMQIYFIDNDDFFRKKGVGVDARGKEYANNGERAIFYARGVIETVKKLGWVPDIVHCVGWMSAIMPFYIRKAFNDEPTFSDCKIVYSATEPILSSLLSKNFEKSLNFREAIFQNVSDITAKECRFDDIQKIAIKYSDGVILESKKVSEDVIEYAKLLSIPVLSYQPDSKCVDAYKKFYDKILGKE
ncbi:MAG: glycogen/starch synthase [Bacteroidaceae bacterium]|nr:glycogen/starch synthase [Bacteroidaceae bacterium]